MAVQKICTVRGCGRLSDQARCPSHRRGPWEGSTRRERLPKRWPSIRRRILARDWLCAICGTSPSTQVDHIRPGDDHDDAAPAPGATQASQAARAGRRSDDLHRDRSNQRERTTDDPDQ
jgi:5-methylcytosine-specific restriction endonuclease McrA